VTTGSAVLGIASVHRVVPSCRRSISPTTKLSAAITALREKLISDKVPRAPRLGGSCEVRPRPGATLQLHRSEPPPLLKAPMHSRGGKRVRRQATTGRAATNSGAHSVCSRACPRRRPHCLDGNPAGCPDGPVRWFGL
jgi:hypothetical protein